MRMSIVGLLDELRREPSLARISRTDNDLAQAQHSLRYWERRRRELPWYRRAQRREAVEMADRWRDRLRAAEHQRLGRGTLGHLAVLLGASAARTLVRRGAIALAILAMLFVAAIAAIVALWPQITSLG
jgi:hypothetical protein